MKTKSLNMIVRDVLLDSGLPLHYYTRYLQHGLRILDELSLDYDLGSVKTVELDITSYGRAILPSDFVDYIDVSSKSGERLLPLERESRLNKMYNYDDAGNKIPFENEANEYIENLNYFLNRGSSMLNSNGQFVGRYYGRERRALFTFDIDKVNQEIVFSNKTTFEKIVLTYVTSAVSKSSANVVTPYAVDTISKYMVMMAAKASGARLGEAQGAKMEFENARRVLRARLNSMDYAEIIGALRRGIHAGIKN